MTQTLAPAPLSVERLGAGRYRVPCGGTCGGGDGHIVTIAPDVVACDCPAGVFRRPCRHVDAVTRYLVQAPPLASIASGPGIVDVDVPPAECDA